MLSTHAPLDSGEELHESSKCSGCVPCSGTCCGVLVQWKGHSLPVLLLLCFSLSCLLFTGFLCLCLSSTLRSVTIDQSYTLTLNLHCFPFTHHEGCQNECVRVRTLFQFLYLYWGRAEIHIQLIKKKKKVTHSSCHPSETCMYTPRQ